VREFGPWDLLGRSLSPVLESTDFFWLDLVVDLFYGGSVLILEEGRA